MVAPRSRESVLGVPPMVNHAHGELHRASAFRTWGQAWTNTRQRRCRTLWIISLRLSHLVHARGSAMGLWRDSGFSLKPARICPNLARDFRDTVFVQFFF